MDSAEEILNEYQVRFILEMYAVAPLPWTCFIIIPGIVLKSIAKADGPRHRNSILHDCLLRACTNILCIHNPNDEYVPHQTLGYTAGSLPLSWNRSTYRVEMAIYRERQAACWDIIEDSYRTGSHYFNQGIGGGTGGGRGGTCPPQNL